jgi:hypothetical protein
MVAIMIVDAKKRFKIGKNNFDSKIDRERKETQHAAPKSLTLEYYIRL